MGWIDPFTNSIFVAKSAAQKADETLPLHPKDAASPMGFISLCVGSTHVVAWTPLNGQSPFLLKIIIIIIKQKKGLLEVSGSKLKKEREESLDRGRKGS